VLNEFAVRFRRGWQRDVALYIGLQPGQIILTPFGDPAVRWNQYTRLDGIPCWCHVAETLLRPFQRNNAPFVSELRLKCFQKTSPWLRA